MASLLSTGPNANALAQLHDIHQPLPIGWWPLAPGWYVLVFLLVVFFVSVVFLGLRYHYHTRAKRQALRVLQRYEEEYLQQPNSQLTASRLSELLKRVALVYYPRTQVASLQGRAWIEFLNETGGDSDFNTVRELLIEMPYKPPEPCDLSPLFHVVSVWIKQRRGRCLN